jgi:uncharacterized protein
VSVGEPPTPSDVEVVSAQLGRPARDIVGISARCVCGNPLVVVTTPRLEDGTPFPTLYYLTHPAATQAASRLEAEGKMVEYHERLAASEPDRDAYRAAHETFLATRESLGTVPEIAGISAGGMPTRVKCLHTLMAHSLSVGPGVNPVGDWALADTPWSKDVCSC